VVQRRIGLYPEKSHLAGYRSRGFLLLPSYYHRITRPVKGIHIVLTRQIESRKWRFQLLITGTEVVTTGFTVVPRIVVPPSSHWSEYGLSQVDCRHEYRAKSELREARKVIRLDRSCHNAISDARSTSSYKAIWRSVQEEKMNLLSKILALETKAVPSAKHRCA
jgi:hypothetical protein